MRLSLSSFSLSLKFIIILLLFIQQKLTLFVTFVHSGYGSLDAKFGFADK